MELQLAMILWTTKYKLMQVNMGHNLMKVNTVLLRTNCYTLIKVNTVRQPIMILRAITH